MSVFNDVDTNSLIKVNCDASIRGKGFVNIGFVFHNNVEKILRVGVDRILRNLNIGCAKILTIRDILRFSKEFMVSTLIFEVIVAE